MRERRDSLVKKHIAELFRDEEREIHEVTIVILKTADPRNLL